MLRIKYPDIDRHDQLRWKGRELLNKVLYWQEKRDGSCISVWLADDNRETKCNLLSCLEVNGGLRRIMISSRYREEAEASIIRGMIATKQWPNLLNLLSDYPDLVIFGEYICRGKSPTKIEPPNDQPLYVVFDIWNKEYFMDSKAVEILVQSFFLSMVKVIKSTIYSTVEELEADIPSMKVWCEVNKREGVVGKVYHDHVFFKEKLERASIRIPKEETVKSAIGPPLPESEISGALMKALVDLGEDVFCDKTKAMPIVAKYVVIEAAKHKCRIPDKLYSYYLDFKGRVENKEMSIT